MNVWHIFVLGLIGRVGKVTYFYVEWEF